MQSHLQLTSSLIDDVVACPKIKGGGVLLHVLDVVSINKKEIRLPPLQGLSQYQM
jgi:hypothetical protein